jgi:hypothetical protein
VPISGVVTVGVFGDFTEDFIVTCGAYSNSADIAVVINIGLTGDNGKGRGNLGFGWIEKKDLQSNKLTRTEYSQTYPYTGQTTAIKEYIETNDTRQFTVFISGGVLSTDGIVSSNG